MAQIPIIEVSQKEWKQLLREYGEGQADYLGKYEDLDATNYPSHEIARGKNKIPGSDEMVLSTTGYLRIGSDIKGSVTALPT